MDGKIHSKRPSEAVEQAALDAALEPLQPPPVFEIHGALTQVLDPAVKALLTTLIANLVDTGRAQDRTT